MTKLSGLQEKIFIDRYSLKDPNGKNAKPGDTVMVLISEGEHAHNQEKAVAEVMEINGDEAFIKTRDERELTVHVNKLAIATETEPEQMQDRLSKAIASVEKMEEKRAEWTQKFRYILDNWKLVPGGRIAAGAGASDELTLFNCYVIPSPKDSRGGIMESLTQMIEIMARGGGVGTNLSTLRPKRALVKGVNGTSSGSVSWGGIFSYATGLVEQGGSRRGALMLQLWDWHPDVLDFITIKETSGMITNANLSVCISNDFMKAVKENGDWTLRFPDTSHEAYETEWDGNIKEWEAKGYPIISYKTIKAREMWDMIIQSAWKSAEPGVVFMEHYNDVSNSWYFNRITATNPCGKRLASR